MRKWLVTIFLAFIFSTIAVIFWFSEWRYSLPTPQPQNYHNVKTGEKIQLAELNSKGKPVFLHFFNPACPCSRFNMPHFKSLAEQYGSKINFAIVVMSKTNNYTVEEIQKKFGLKIPVLFNRSLADVCGVYSTPQAAILDA